MQLNIHYMSINMNTLSGLLIIHEPPIPRHSEGMNLSWFLEALCCEEIIFFFLNMLFKEF